MASMSISLNVIPCLEETGTIPMKFLLMCLCQMLILQWQAMSLHCLPKEPKFPYVEEYRDKAQVASYRRAHRVPKPVWSGLTSDAPAVSLFIHSWKR